MAKRSQSKKRQSSSGESAGSHASSPSNENADRETPRIATLHLWQFQFVRDILVVGLVFALIWAGYALRAVTVPLLIALVLAYLFEPLIAWLQQRTGRSRTVVVSGVLSTVGVAAVLVLAAVISLAVSQTSALVSAYRGNEFYNAAVKLEPAVPESFQPEFEALLNLLGTPEQVQTDNNQQPEEATQQADESTTADETAANTDANDDAAPTPTTVPQSTDNETTAIAATEQERLRALIREELNRQPLPQTESPTTPWLEMARSGVRRIVGMIGAVIGIGLLVFLIPFYFFFFSVAYPKVLDFLKQLIPEQNKQRTLELIRKMDEVVAGFVRGRIVISLIMGVMLAIGWRIVGVPYSVVLGVVTGIFCAVPYLGGVGVPVAIGLMIFQKLGNPEAMTMSWWGIFIWPTVVFVLVQLIEAYLLTPKIAGKVTNLDPVTIIVAVLAGGSVMGAYGMILAIPLAACAKILIVEVVMPRFLAWTRGEAPDPLPLGRGES